MGVKMKRKYDVFISYRRDGGEATAKTLFDTLARRGYQVFFDVESLRSGDFNKALYSVIDECRDFVLILSPNALARCENENDWVRLEIEHALEKGLNIVPIMLRGFEFPAELPPSMEAVRYKNGLQSNYDFFDAFIDKLQTFLLSRPTGRRRRGFFFAGCAALAIMAAIVILVWPKAPGGRGDDGEPREPSAAATAEGSEGFMAQETGAAADVPEQEEPTPRPEAVYRNLLMADPGEITDFAGNVLGIEGLQRSSVVTVTFLDQMDSVPAEAADVSAEQNGFIKAWAEPGGLTREATPGFDLYIASRGQIVASSCEALFANYKNLEEIHFNHCFYTDGAVSMERMFDRCTSLTGLDLSDFNTEDVVSMAGMFTECRSLRELDLSAFDTGKVKSMWNMFGACENLKEMDISGFDMANVENVEFLFNLCNALETVRLDGLDMGNVITMRCMFQSCKSLESVDLSGLRTERVENMASVFNNCTALRKVNMSGLNTENVTNMEYMFQGCSSLTELDLSSLDTGKVTTMRGMFRSCTSLETLDLSGLETGGETDTEDMFYNCPRLSRNDETGTSDTD